jgi:hypothetical protein
MKNVITKSFLIGFFVATGWTVGQFLTRAAITYWIELLKPATIVKGILF